MYCEHVKLPGGQTAIVSYTGSRPKAEKCAFCSSRGTKLCDWPMEKPVKIAHGKLKEGDTIVTRQNKYRLRVQGFQRFRTQRKDIRTTMTVRVTMYGLVFPDGRCWLYYCVGKDQVSVLRPGTCDAPCCEAHSRSVDDDKDYCQDHWTSWESA